MAPLPDPAIQTSAGSNARAVVSPQAGMYYPVSVPADPTGRVTCGASALVTLPNAAYTSGQSPVVFSTAYITNIALDISVISFTGGTTPTIQFILERQGADGTYYNVLQSQTFSSAGTNTVDIGPGFANSFSPPNGEQHAVFTQQARLRWVFGGTAPPTSVTFSASAVGR